MYDVSKIFCHGLIWFGFRIISFLFSYIERKISGTSLFFVKSPPPITFPALSVKEAYFFLIKKRLIIRI